VLLFVAQPVLGVVQHRQFLRTGVRSIYSGMHVWYGRLLICLGIINGGLGLQLASNSTGRQKAIYIVMTILMLITYVAAQLWYHWKIKQTIRTQIATEMGEKEEGDRMV
jgi:sulfite exporter TauE/SafE